MLWKLIALRIRGAFSGKAIQGKGKWAAVLTAVLFVYLAACVGGLMYLLFSALCAPFVAAGLGWYYFGLAGLTAFTLAFVGSIFAAQSQLYDARDNEMLLSMPIRPGLILGSRMVFLWVLDLCFVLLILVPAEIAYAVQFPVTAPMALCLGAVCLLLPCLSLTCSALAAWGTAALTGRMGRHKTLFTMVLSLAFLACYFYVYSQIQTILGAILSSAGAVAQKLAAVFPVYHMGLAMAGGRGVSLLITAACCLLPLALACWLLSRSFLTIATRKRGMAKVQYKGGPMEAASLDQALLRREAKRLTSSAIYMMNCGFGALMLLILAAAAVWKRALLRALLAAAPIPAAPAVSAAVCLLASMVLITAPSVSLEGKTLWLLQSLPVSPWAVLRAKLRLHLLIAMPCAAVSALVLCVCLDLSPAQWLPVLLPPLASCWFSACAGLALNLCFPKLDWISEAAAVKQGLAMFLSMLSALGTVFLAIGLYAVLSPLLPEAAILLLLAVLFAAAALLLERWLKRRGTARFAGLHA